MLDSLKRFGEPIGRHSSCWRIYELKRLLFCHLVDYPFERQVEMACASHTKWIEGLGAGILGSFDSSSHP